MIADTVGSLYATRFRADEDDGAVQKGRERSPGRWKRDGDGRYTDVEVSSDGPWTTVAASGGVSSAFPPSVVLALVLVVVVPVEELRWRLDATRHRWAEAETPLEHARRTPQENILVSSVVINIYYCKGLITIVTSIRMYLATR